MTSVDARNQIVPNGDDKVLIRRNFELIRFAFRDLLSATTLTAKGDLITYSTELVRKAVGTDGHLLFANSGETDGLEWRALAAGDATLASIAGSTYSTVQHLASLGMSSGQISGGAITDAGSATINVAAGTGWIRATDSDTAEILFFDWAASNGVSIPSNSVRYVGVEYNAGSPTVVVSTTQDWDYDTEFPLGRVVNEGGTLYILNDPWHTGDAIGNIIERFDSESYIARDNRTGGLIVSNSGTRNVAVTAGALLSRLDEYSISGIDTSSSGTFDAYYRDGSGGWTKQSAQTQWNNSSYDNGSGTLQSIPLLSYSSRWWYLMTDGTLAMLYGQSTSTAIGALLDADSPPASVPNRIDEMGILIGRFVIQASGSTPVVTQSAFDNEFAATGVTDHGELSGLSDDDHSIYHTDARALTWLGTRDTDDLPEGATNLYFTAAEETKLAGIEALADVTDATNVDSAGAVMNSDTSTATMNFVIDEDTMASDSATKVPTQQSVKAYVDASGGGGVTALEVATIADPSTELNAIAGSTVGELRLCYQAGPGTVNIWTLYAWDDSAGSESVPYLVDGSSGQWQAIAGRYVNSALSVRGAVTVPSVKLLFGATVAEFSIDGTLAGNADGAVPTEKAIKTYVDGLTTVATQAEMETGTAVNRVVTPGRQHYHPGHPKSWVNFNGSGTVAIRDSYGVSSITDNGTGDYTVNFSTAFSTDDYCPVASGQLSSSPAGRNYVAGIETTSTTASRLRCVAGDGNFYDYDFVYVAYYGDQ